MWRRIRGAGAVLKFLPGTKSPEALAAIAAFEAAKPRLREIVLACSSGRELLEGGFASDVEIAAQCNVSTAVPIVRDGAFVALRAG